MKKFSIIFLVLFLILFTAIVKNSTKRIDDEIFVIKETIGILKKDLEDVKLEYDYLSSADKLLEFQDLYFDNVLIKKNLQDIKVITQKSDNLEVKQLKFFDEK
tara:strand:- start:14 stop:322 length:309 start_codon:yes stop_codon:yes gene_type:complete